MLGDKKKRYGFGARSFVGGAKMQICQSVFDGGLRIFERMPTGKAETFEGNNTY